jgi:hypothetical protein
MSKPFQVLLYKIKYPKGFGTVNVDGKNVNLLNDIGEPEVPSDVLKNKTLTEILPYDPDTDEIKATSLEASYNPLNWQNSRKNEYRDQFRKALIEFKKQIPQYADKLVQPPVDLTEMVTAINDIRTILSNFDNTASFSFDAVQLEALLQRKFNESLLENDVIEFKSVLADNTLQREFIGFVTSVTIEKSYGNIFTYTVQCAGLSKLLVTTSIVNTPAVVSQFESGVDIDVNEFTPFSNLFMGLDAKELFTLLLYNIFHVTPTSDSALKLFAQNDTVANAGNELYAYFYDKKRTYGNAFQQGIDLTKFHLGNENYFNTFAVTEAINKAVRQMENDKAFGTETDSPGLPQKAPEGFIPDLQIYFNLLKEYNHKKGSYNAMLQSTRAQRTKDTENAKRLQTRTKTEYKFEPFKKEPTSFQVSHLLVYTFAKAHGNEEAIAEMTGGDMKVFNEMVRKGMERFYSQLSTPAAVLGTLREVCFYDLFEDRQGKIICRPPLYNRFDLAKKVGNKYEIDTSHVIFQDEIISLTRTRQDIDLKSRVDYKNVFPFKGEQPFVAGHYTEPSVLCRYGLRAGAPNTNPNVQWWDCANLFSALELIRQNLYTRRLTLVVPWTRSYELGTLYYIPDDVYKDGSLINQKGSKEHKKGVVGYLSEISSSISYGGVPTHTLSFVAVREAETYYTKDNVPMLNFRKLPDQETFMFLLEKNNLNNKSEADKNATTPTPDVTQQKAKPGKEDAKVYEVDPKKINTPKKFLASSGSTYYKTLIDYTPTNKFSPSIPTAKVKQTLINAVIATDAKLNIKSSDIEIVSAPARSTVTFITGRCAFSFIEVEGINPNKSYPLARDFTCIISDGNTCPVNPSSDVTTSIDSNGKIFVTDPDSGYTEKAVPLSDSTKVKIHSYTKQPIIKIDSIGSLFESVISLENFIQNFDCVQGVSAGTGKPAYDKMTAGEGFALSLNNWINCQRSGGTPYGAEIHLSNSAFESFKDALSNYFDVTPLPLSGIESSYNDQKTALILTVKEVDNYSYGDRFTPQTTFVWVTPVGAVDFRATSNEVKEQK